MYAGGDPPATQRHERAGKPRPYRGQRGKMNVGEEYITSHQMVTYNPLTWLDER